MQVHLVVCQHDACEYFVPAFVPQASDGRRDVVAGAHVLRSHAMQYHAVLTVLHTEYAMSCSHIASWDVMSCYPMSCSHAVMQCHAMQCDAMQC